MKFTKGPWKVHHHYHINNEQWLSVINGAWDIDHNYARNNGVIADARYSAMSAEENLANAHLIAAAPEMYEVLKEIYKEWDGEPEDMIPVLEVLAKARGESNGT